ncbi:MAG: universal stress protein [Hyphomicrobiales bacterium]
MARRSYGYNEAQAQKEFEELREKRRNRFRILACVDGTDESFLTARYAARMGWGKECDIIILYVRPIDQGLRSGGLQVGVARQNMLDWGLDLPGIRYLKHGVEILKEEGQSPEDWSEKSSHQDTWGDPLGDNKVEYINDNGKSVVLKLKTAPDPASGILDQYELGPYNLMIMGEPSRWRGEFKSVFDVGVVQKVSTLSPCSVLIARDSVDKKGFFMCTDGTDRCADAVRRAAVLARYMKQPITLFSVAPDRKQRQRAEDNIEHAKGVLKEMKIRADGTKIGIGDSVEQIIKHGAGHSVIVVNDSGKGRIKRIFAPSVAFSVMRAAKNSVLNVR